jgi:hypothetical protein
MTRPARARFGHTRSLSGSRGNRQVAPKASQPSGAGLHGCLPSHPLLAPRPNNRPRGWFIACCLAAAIGGGAQAEERLRDQAAFFETKIRPLLAEHCWKCHGAAKQKGGLRLDQSTAFKEGGDSGPAVEPGKPADSVLIRAVRWQDGVEMPPGRKLPESSIKDLEAWVASGAHWPAEASAVTGGNNPVPRSSGITDADRNHWSFRPIKASAPPGPSNGAAAAHPIDAFLDAELAAVGIKPNGPAGPRELTRRIHFDVIGLPPSGSEVAAFTANPSDKAWEGMVDRLLALPQYGERQGRHWLDVVRYAQTNGYERDSEKPYAWRYRDYVIRAFQDDKPFDRFIVEQLAGDLLDESATPASTDDSKRVTDPNKATDKGARDPARSDERTLTDPLVATGFYRLGVWDDEPDDKRQARYDELDDILATAGQAFLGLTLQCARCHDHKYDPIPQRDYYRMLGFVHEVRGYDFPKHAPDSAVLRPIGPRDRVEAWFRNLVAQRAETEKRIGDTKDPAAKKAKQAALKDFEIECREGPFPWTLAVSERPGKPEPVRVLIRGNAGTPGETVEPGFLSVLGDVRTEAAKKETNAERRVRLAAWIASPNNPLTARVIVNRIWKQHFGRGLVETTNDFGRNGLAPSHPALLDWLATEFIRGGWRIKPIHRLILTSAAYRRSTSTENALGVAKDQDNRKLWRQSLRRLDAESMRDSMLAVAGTLDLKSGGPGVFPTLSADVLAGQSRPGEGWQNNTPPETQLRRSVYLFSKRTLGVPMMELFDQANSATPVGERMTTTVAPQALLLLHDHFVHRQAAALAGRLRKESGVGDTRPVKAESASSRAPDGKAPRESGTASTDAELIRAGYRLALQREPKEDEVAELSRYLATAPADPDARSRQLALILLNLNEFAYVD